MFLKVALFITCLADVFYPGVGKDTVDILEKLGCEVVFPEGQTCCGQPAYNSGYHRESKSVAEHMIKTFESADYVVSPSGSCVLMIQEYAHLFQANDNWRQKAEELAAKTFELTQFIVDILKVEDIGASLSTRATYHTSCHMTRLLSIKDAPMKLLSNVKGLEFANLPNKETCCGFGGTFSVKMVPISEQMVNEKIEHIEETGAEILIGADCGCLMNIGGRIDRQGKPIKTMHIAQVLNSKE
jgi:L-lactate dehydrogenase complex protein LldE